MSEAEDRQPRRPGRWAGIGVACAVLAAAVAIPTFGMVFGDSVDQPQAAAAANAVVAPNQSAMGAPQEQFKLMPPAADPVAPAPVPEAAAPEVATNISPTVISSKDVLKLVKKYFPADQVGNAMAVASCESGQKSIKGETNSDGTTDWGIFQMNDGGTLQSTLPNIGVQFTSKEHAQQLALDPDVNVRAAASLMYSRGWAPWVCAYKQQIVAELYSNVPGPMYGKFTTIGVATISPEVLKEQEKLKKQAEKQKQKDEAKRKREEAARKKAEEKAKREKAAREAAEKAEREKQKQTPTPTPSTTATP